MNGELSLLVRQENLSYGLIERKLTPAREDSYSLIKTICHFGVSLYETLEHTVQEKIPLGDSIIRLNQLKVRIVELKSLDSISPSSIASTADLLLKFIDEFSSCPNLKRVELVKGHYLQEAMPIFDAYCEQAAALQLHGLHDICTDWFSKQPIKLDKTYMMIVGPRGPRKELIEYQYLSKLRAYHGVEANNTAASGLIYSEMLPQQMSNVSFDMLIEDLARDVHNMQIGFGMLADIDAMHKDILGKYAQVIIDRDDEKA